QQAGELRGAPAPFAGDDLKPIADPPHYDRLDDAIGLDRLRELLEPGLVDVAAWLEFIRREAVDVRLDSGGRPWWRQVRNQCAEAFTECGAFFHGATQTAKTRRHEEEHFFFVIFLRAFGPSWSCPLRQSWRQIVR